MAKLFRKSLSCGIGLVEPSELTCWTRPSLLTERSRQQLSEAFITSYNWFSREDARAFAVPPVHVLRNLFSGWDWLKTIQYNRFAPVTPFPRSVLSDSEQILVEVIFDTSIRTYKIRKL
jgi:hypothetical protein